jgi:RNA polymerase sigma-70 factor (ECF subfamily)
MQASARPATDYAGLSDIEIARLCASRDKAAFRHLMIANNQRLFRTAWSVLRDRSESEEAVQAAYVSAFASIGSFAGRSSLSTWLTRIVLNEALGRLRVERRRRANLEEGGVTVLDSYRETLMRGSAPTAPDAAIARDQIRLLMEQAIARLPHGFRTVFVLREIEGLSSKETAELLGIGAATVKTRLLRARQRLQAMLTPELGSALAGTFPFAGADCSALTQRVLTALRL